MYDDDSRSGVRINWMFAGIVSVIIHAVVVFLFVSSGRSPSGGDGNAGRESAPAEPPPIQSAADPQPDPTPTAGAPEQPRNQTAAAGNTAATAGGQAQPVAARPAIYIVQAGDSLTRIASRYELTVAELAKANGLSVTAGLRIGQRLKLPR